MRQVLLFSVLLSLQGAITCVRIRELRVPAHVPEGSEVILGCMFELQGQRLFSVKWSKDGQAFYHYRPGSGSSSVPDTQAFQQTGVAVDLARSSMGTVTLVYMSRDSAGVYRCEVTGEGPLFRRSFQEKNMTVDLLPEKDPQVSGLQENYRVGSPVEVNCSSLGTRPATQVQWFINNMVAPKYLTRGPWYTRSLLRLDAVDTTLELNFGVRGDHFIYGVMTLKCQVTLAPLYHKEVEFKYRIIYKGQGNLMETTTKQHYEVTTEKPCNSTITVDLPQPAEQLEPWPLLPPSPEVASAPDPDGAVFMKYSLEMLFFCILAQILQ